MVTMSTNQPATPIRLGHSPDPDDAFMFYALAHGKIDTRGLVFEHILEGIEGLNHRALRGELEVTALSVHGYAHVADRYILLPHGASVGDGYGPLLVAPSKISLAALRGKKIAVPGTLTTAFLVARLCLGEFDYTVVAFDKIFDVLRRGEAQAGLIIHEGQLTHEHQGFHCLIDLGRWWRDETGLPLALGVNAVRKDLGPLIPQISQILHESITYGLDHRREAMDYALRFARNIPRDLADRFVGMYVNDFTLDLGPRGRRAIQLLLERGYNAGIIPNYVRIHTL